MSTVLITGASSGIGLATALEFARTGHTVYASMRNPANCPELREKAEEEALAVKIVRMDVDSGESVSHCFSAIYGQGGKIDVLVNNAGIDRHGSVEELPMEDFRATMETNYFGALRCIRHVLPYMRESRKGWIINVTSVAGKIASSPLGAYAASKFALEAVSEVLAQEVKPFGLRVAIVQPGIIDTPMARAFQAKPGSRYRQGDYMDALFKASLEHPTPASVVAKVIGSIVESNEERLRYPAGPDAEPLLRWRAAMTDEDWTKLNALNPDEYRKRIKNDFGLDLNLSSEDANSESAEAAHLN